jgi:hypothetical protein
MTLKQQISLQESQSLFVGFLIIMSLPGLVLYFSFSLLFKYLGIWLLLMIAHGRITRIWRRKVLLKSSYPQVFVQVLKKMDLLNAGEEQKLPFVDPKINPEDSLDHFLRVAGVEPVLRREFTTSGVLVNMIIGFALVIYLYVVGIKNVNWIVAGCGILLMLIIFYRRSTGKKEESHDSILLHFDKKGLRIKGETIPWNYITDWKHTRDKVSSVFWITIRQENGETEDKYYKFNDKPSNAIKFYLLMGYFHAKYGM